MPHASDTDVQLGVPPSQPRVTYTLREIHAHVGGELLGDAALVIAGVNALEAAQPGELAFAENQRYARFVQGSRASAVIVPQAFPAIEGRALLRVGDRVVFGGQAGVADHLTIGDDTRIGAGSGVIKDVPPGQTVWWFPARPIQRVKQELASLTFVPKLVKGLGRPKPTGRRSARS